MTEPVEYPDAETSDAASVAAGEPAEASDEAAPPDEPE